MRCLPHRTGAIKNDRKQCAAIHVAAQQSGVGTHSADRRMLTGQKNTGDIRDFGIALR
jgi:hypothetical protein